MSNWHLGNPMMTYDEREAFEAYVRATPKDCDIIEYGCGGSTVLLQSMIEDRNVLSVEHHPDWWMNVKKEIWTPQITLVYEPNQFDKELWSRTGCEHEELAAGGYRYIHAPRLHTPKRDWNKTGLVLVDGMARGACLAWLRSYLTPNTTVLLHDFAGREPWYAWATALYDVVTLTRTLLELRVPR